MATSTGTIATYTVADTDAPNPDFASVTFRIEVVDTEISVIGLHSPVYEDKGIAFTVTVTDVPLIDSYDLDVTAYESGVGAEVAGSGRSMSTTGSTTAFITTSTTPNATIASTMPATEVIMALLPFSI